MSHRNSSCQDARYGSSDRLAAGNAHASDAVGIIARCQHGCDRSRGGAGGHTHDIQPMGGVRAKLLRAVTKEKSEARVISEARVVSLMLEMMQT